MFTRKGAIALKFDHTENNVTEANICSFVKLLAMMGEIDARDAVKAVRDGLPKVSGNVSAEVLERLQREFDEVWELALVRYRSGGDKNKLN